MENEADSMRNEAEELGLKLPADDAEDTTTYEAKGEGATEPVSAETKV